MTCLNKRVVLRYFLSFFPLLFILIPGCFYSDQQVKGLFLTSEFDERNLEAINISTEFEADTPIIYCVAKISNTDINDVIKFQWFQLIDNQEILLRQSIHIPTEEKIYSYLDKPYNYIRPPGKYMVLISLNEKEVSRMSFEIKAKTSLSDFNTASGIDKDGNPVALARVFSRDAEDIYLFAFLTNPSDFTLLRFDWYYLEDKARLLHSTQFNATREGYVHTKLSKSEIKYEGIQNAWPRGRYQVVVFLDGREIKKVDFSVQ